MELLTTAQMRAIEQSAITSGRVTARDLMERAGRAVVEAILAEWPDLGASPRRAAVICGPGNNGGDGFVVARLLAEHGWQVSVGVFGRADRLGPEARANHDRWQARGGRTWVSWPADLEGQPELVIDAGYGIGLRLPCPEVAMIRDAVLSEGERARWVAIDLPSGVEADTGRAADWAPRVDLTVTFEARKLGHLLGEGAALCGKVVVKPIGLSHDLAQCDEAASGSAAPLPRLLGPVGRCALHKAGGHKYSHGHALILSGPPGRGGAARLAARGALRVGAGLVTLACPPDAMAENAARLDAVMLHPLPDAAALAALLRDRRINALCLGPGFGTGPREAALLSQALAAGRPMVVDADALTLVAADPALMAALHHGCVLTPHGGEFARLFPDVAAALQAPPGDGPAMSKVAAARAAAARAGCVVLFKGADTVIAAPDGACSVNAAVQDHDAPWLATAGAGDVLAGLIAGLLARGQTPMAAAGVGAWLHVAAARRFGPGLIAEDLPEALPGVFRDLGL